MREQTSEAIVLRHIDYGEADRIVTLLTPDHGTIRGFARSARKSRRRFGAALDPFSRITIRWSPSRSGDLVTLKEAEIVDLRVGLRSDLSSFALAAYGCELVDELLGKGPADPNAFELLDAFLDYLSHGGSVPEARLLLELRTLYLAGYIPHLLHCADCDRPFTDGEAAFDATRGGSHCLDCLPHSSLTVAVGTLGTLSRSLQAPLTLFTGFRFGPRTLKEGGAVLADALRLCLRAPLRSLPFLDSLIP